MASCYLSGGIMDYSDFIGQVQHRLQLGKQGQAVRAIRATLTTLGERLQEGEAKDLAGPLPMEIDWYLLQADSGQRFHFDEFVSRVAEREIHRRGGCTLSREGCTIARRRSRSGRRVRADTRATPRGVRPALRTRRKRRSVRTTDRARRVFRSGTQVSNCTVSCRSWVFMTSSATSRTVKSVSIS